MSNSKSTTKLDDYNDDPVFYCSECLSLRILSLDGDDYCDECGCTDIRTTHIVDWEKLYEQKYNKKFLNNGKGSKSRG